jgi:hypothetical protein
MADFRATQNQVAAAFANASTTQAGLAKNLTRAQAREYAALQRIAGKGNAQSALVNQRLTAKAVNRYGTALGPGIQQQMGVARAQEKATSNIGKSNVRAGKLLTEAGQTALGIQQSATEEAQASAEYATAVALKSRNQENAAQVAEMQFTLQEMRLDNKFAIQQMERQYALELQNSKELMELQREDLEPEVATNLALIQDMGVNSFLGLQRLFNTPVEGGGYLQADEAADMYAQQVDAVPGTPQYSVILAVAKAMYAAGAGPTNVGTNPLGDGGLYGEGANEGERSKMVFDAVKETMMRLYPDYADLVDENYETMTATTTAQFTREAMERATEEARREGGDDTSGMVDTYLKYMGIKDSEGGWWGTPYFLGGPMGPAWYAVGEGEGVAGTVKAYTDIVSAQLTALSLGKLGLGAAAAAKGASGGKVASAIYNRLGMTSMATKPPTTLPGLSLPGGSLPPPPGFVPGSVPGLSLPGGVLPPAPSAAQAVSALRAETAMVTAGRGAGTWSLEKLSQSPTVRKVAEALGRPVAEIAELMKAAVNGSEAAKRTLDAYARARARLP